MTERAVAGVRSFRRASAEARSQDGNGWRRFYRIDQTRSRDAGGAGLGLCIARRAVEAQGGHIELESDEGRGGTFRIVLAHSRGAISN